jgi:hypothetical protein
MRFVFHKRTLLPNFVKRPLFSVSQSNNGILTSIDPKIIFPPTMFTNKHRFPTSCLMLAASSLTRFSRKVSAKHCQQTLLAFFLTAFTISCDEKHQSQNVESKPERFQTVTINNIKPRRDVAGKIIDAHGGCLQFFEGRYYLYGTAFGTNENSLALNCPFRVYSSPDLERWTYEGELLKERPDGIYIRPCVVFNPHTRKYVLWYNWFAKLWNGQTAAATSDTPVGPFKIANPNVQLSHPGTGDGSLFVDDDGTGYYIYTAISEGYTISVERLTPDYLGATGESSSVLGVGGEAPVLFRRNNLYYALFGARCADCLEGSEAQVFVSTSPLGPFTTNPQANINRRPENTGPAMSTQKTWVATVPTPSGLVTFHSEHAGPVIPGNNVPFLPAQQTWVAKIPTIGEPAFFWMADRWQSTPDGVKGHDFQFWSAPLKFDPDGSIEPLKDVAQWHITWGAGN